jgi:hypothetical protein
MCKGLSGPVTLGITDFIEARAEFTPLVEITLSARGFSLSKTGRVVML